MVLVMVTCYVSVNCTAKINEDMVAVAAWLPEDTPRDIHVVATRAREKNKVFLTRKKHFLYYHSTNAGERARWICNR